MRAESRASIPRACDARAGASANGRAAGSADGAGTDRAPPVRGVIADFLPLGENASTVIRVEATDERLQVTFPLHVARRNGLEAGAEVVVSLLRDGIHLMPD